MAFVPLNDPVAKGAVTRALDDISVRRDARSRLEALRRALRELQATEFRRLEYVFAEHLLRHVFPDKVDAMTAYLGRYWFNERTGWWPAFQPIAPIYAQGLLQALNVSLEGKGRPRPFDSYWILGHDGVEMITLASTRQLTLLIATPHPPEPAPSGITSEESNAWVTARRAGTTANEIDPLTGQTISPGDATLRERTFKIQTRGGSSSSRARRR